VAEIDPLFRALLNRLVREVFDTYLEPKEVAGRTVTASDLLTYFQVYVKIFQTTSKGFPRAMTLLDATAEANNRTALQHALDSYKTALTTVVNDTAPYREEILLLVRY
jgi:hypothetical protein